MEDFRLALDENVSDIENVGSLAVPLRCDGGASFYGSNFGTNVELWEDKRAPKIAPSARSDYRRNPQHWTNKRELKHVMIKYKKDG